MKAIDQKLVTQFIKKAADRLSGDWVIVGGSVLHLLGIGSRVTLDIDVASTRITNQSTSVLYDIGSDLGLPVEAINTAASYFLEKVSGWQKDLVIVRSGKKGKFYRPNATLYVLLKIQRMSESDLQDCLQMLSNVDDTEIDVRRLVVAIKKRQQQVFGAESERLAGILANLNS